jgi:predicted metal-dependent hydrolase
MSRRATLDVASDTATLDLPGGPIQYVLRRSPRSRRLRVTIDPLEGVIVSVPPRTRRGWARAEPMVESFLREREPWLRRHLTSHALQRAELAERGGVADGARIRFRGELHRLRLVPAAEGGVRGRRSRVTREGTADGDELIVRLAAGDRRAVSDVLVEWFRERARKALEREIAAHAPALKVQPAGFGLRDPKSRWGSASREGRLSFSWRLVLAPPEALETVVVHELAHLRYFGHGPRFWALVATRRPDHVEWRRWLAAHSLELHGALATS